MRIVCVLTHTRWLPTLLLAGCLERYTGPIPDTQAVGSADAATPRVLADAGADLARATAIDAALPFLGGLVESPANAQVLTGETLGLAVVVAGYYAAADAAIDVQVLADPTQPLAAASWTSLATTTSSATPTMRGDADPVYAWSASVVPVADASAAARWPDGGVVRLRVVAHDPAHGGDVALGTVESDYAACGAGRSWKQAQAACASPEASSLALVSPTPSPSGAAAPRYLTAKGTIGTSDTDAYYAAIKAPSTLAGFLGKYGFAADGKPASGATEATATFYNRLDLGIGREMHCTSFSTSKGAATGRACYVKNYGVDAKGAPAFGGDPTSALADAVARTRSFAAVCMIDDPSLSANEVQFIVYDGATGNLRDNAQLDNTGANTSIPNNCLACHGGSGSYDKSTKQVVGAHFLPFDVPSFVYSTKKGYARADEEDALRRLNAHVRAAAASTDAIAALIDGAYAASVNDAGASYDDSWVPAGYTAADPATDRLARSLYANVVKPYCRTCHVSQTSYPLASYAELSQLAPLIAHDVCQGYTMPQAERTFTDAWTGSARAHLVNALGLPTACAP